MQLWRISDHQTLNGVGGLRASGRWHTAGHRIVYLADHPAGCLLEVLVHLDYDEVVGLPEQYTLLQAEVPSDIVPEDLAQASDDVWRSAFRASRKLGDDWLKAERSVLARVPSSIVPFTWNYLLNPVHPDAERIAIATSTRSRFDPRLIRQGTHE